MYHADSTKSFLRLSVWFKCIHVQHMNKHTHTHHLPPFIWCYIIAKLIQNGGKKSEQRFLLWFLILCSLFTLSPSFELSPQFPKPPFLCVQLHSQYLHMLYHQEETLCLLAYFPQETRSPWRPGSALNNNWSNSGNWPIYIRSLLSVTYFVLRAYPGCHHGLIHQWILRP